MNRRKFSAALLRFALALAGAAALSLCFARASSAQEARPAPTPRPLHAFREAKPVIGKALPGPEAFEFETNGFSYYIRQNGNGWRKKGDRVRRFNLRLDQGGLERVYFS